MCSLTRNSADQLKQTKSDGEAADHVDHPQILKRASRHLNKLLIGLCSREANFVATACNIAADVVMGAFLRQEPTIHPDSVHLAGNYAPRHETPPQPCLEIEGALPPDLDGIYIRNGPNATRIFEHERYHMFDGDGMLHGVRIHSGRASYCCRYVRTSRFVQEELAGRPLFLRFFGGLNGSNNGFVRAGLLLLRVVLGALDISEGWGVSNTNVCYFNGKVLSLSEDDMPYVIKVTKEVDLITLGRFQFLGDAPGMNMCAQPKFDLATGEMFAFSFRPSLKGPFYFYKVSPSGVKSREVSIPLREISCVHDFVITENYAIFPDNQIVIRPWRFLRGEMAIMRDKSKTPRFCIMRRDATTQAGTPWIMWFNAPDCNAFHYINGWEEGDQVVIITPIISHLEGLLDITARGLTCQLTELRFNLTDGSTSVKPLCYENLEFGTYNLKYMGRKTRYVYLGVGCYPEHPTPKFFFLGSKKQSFSF